VLTKIYGNKTDEMVGGWRNKHSEELYNLHSSSNLIRIIKLKRLKLEGHVALLGENRNAYRILVGKSQRKRPAGY
jgi:hypothetical protein